MPWKGSTPSGGTAAGTTGRSSGHRRTMSGDAASLCDARHMVASALEESSPELREVAALLTGEVVTNAVLHGG
ncbi:MAG: hypothetical protein ACRDV8_06195, partial [Acidimicrobiales bacterium]